MSKTSLSAIASVSGPATRGEPPADSGSFRSELAFAIEAREAAQESAHEQAEVLRAVVESIADLVIQVDLSGRIRFVNRLPAGKLSGDVIGTQWLAYIGAEQHEQVSGLLERTLSTGETTGSELLSQGDDGAMVWYWTRIAPVKKDGTIVGAVLIAHDITEKKHTQAQLVLSDRLASVGGLAAGVAHEINNPLASVMANLELAIGALDGYRIGSPLPEELEEELRDALHSAQRVRQIVSDLNIFSRSEDEKHGPIQVEQVIESTLRMACHEIRHRARLIKNYGAVPLVDANGARLGQVFLNLIMNAAQAIAAGDSEHNAIIISTGLSDDGRVVVNIADTGPGIPRDVQRRLFTPFFTTKAAGASTGLGLCICQRIIASLGGEISFASEPGQGAEFRVLLPAAQHPSALERTLPPRDSRPGRRGAVLIVDDEILVTRALKRIVSPDHQVFVENSAASALAIIQAGARFDAILCDVMMPQVTGAELYGELQRFDADQAARVVFMTGGTFVPKTRQFLAGVPNQWLEKPFDVDKVRAMVNDLVG